jgi:glycosyltransferase involved in cell wall biosynthesis
MKNIFITGSGRSGTSLLAGMFAKSEYFFGDKLYPAREANAKGFYEDEEVNALNEEIILDTIARSAPGFSPDAVSDYYKAGQLWLARLPINMQFGANADQISKIENLTNRQPFCFKDPRFCFTLENWMPTASDHVVFCIFRNPASTAMSILRECHNAPYLFDLPISVDNVFALWREIYWRLLRLYREHNNIFFVHYEDVLQGRMIGKLEDAAETELDKSFPDTALNRSTPGLPLDHKSKLVFDVLLEISKGDLGGRHDNKRLELIRELDDALLGSSLSSLPETKRGLSEFIYRKNFEQELENVGRELTRLRRAVTENAEQQNMVLAMHSKELQILSKELQSQRITQEGALLEREEQLATSRAALQERDQTLQERDQTLQERDQTLQERDQTLQERDQTIDELLASRSWRLTAPIRWVKTISLRSLRALKLLFAAARPGRNIEKIKVLRAIYRKLPLPLALKERMRTIIIRRLPFVRNRLLSGNDIRVGLDNDDGSNYDYARTLPGDETWVLVAEQRIPTPDRTSSSNRLHAILEILVELGYKITFISHSDKDQYHWIFDNQEDIRPYEKELANKDISVLYGFKEALAHLKSEGYKYKYAFLCYPEIAYQYIPLVRAYSLHAHVIYDTVDLHSLRYAREAEMKGDDSLREQAENYDKMERLNIECSDLVIAITDEERKQIRSMVPGKKVEIVPNIHAISPPTMPLADRKDLLFIGHYLHSPNEDAVKYFIRDIFPIIQKSIPDLKITLLGSSVTKTVQSLAGPNVKVVGYVQDPTPYFNNARVFVAPLRYGAGMKGKIGHSMSLGLPVVTTDIGAEGMMLRDGENVLIGDSPEQFAENVIKLYTDDALWEVISKAGMSHIDENFSYGAVRRTLESIFDHTDDKIREPENSAELKANRA